MNMNLTEVVFVLDASGSMNDVVADTIGGFNSMIDEQCDKEGDAIVSVVTFNSESSVAYGRVDIREIEPLTNKQYRARGSTALLDAVGGAIQHIANIHKYARNDDVPARTIFVITTDGMENASHTYTFKEINRMVNRQKAQHDWEFLFLGANIDAFDVAGRLGIPKNRAAQFMNDSESIKQNYCCFSAVMSDLRSGEDISDDWSEEIDCLYEEKKEN